LTFSSQTNDKNLLTGILGATFAHDFSLPEEESPTKIIEFYKLLEKAPLLILKIFKDFTN
jgi:hypothetical protein